MPVHPTLILYVANQVRDVTDLVEGLIAPGHEQGNISTSFLHFPRRQLYTIEQYIAKSVVASIA